MTKQLEIYKCEICGNIIEIIHAGNEAPRCSEHPMKQLLENTTDASKEKHVPVIEKVNGAFKVVIGSVPHPMEEKHFIEWIELIADGKAYRQFLNPKDKPEAFFKIEADNVVAREHCNLHGLWKNQI
ncbi:MAG: desulfoferrodoxin [Armatimonadetes bacterium]|nr:desulfoferrodoxin [Armatimonadota bacterium]